tara:strand:- start:1539 stop:1907 length:369 start_codon:yes stop_codon:yes gene_type:complete
MADFPSLTPQSRTYTPGSYAALRTSTFSGSEISVRRNNAAFNHRLRLTFISESITDQNTVFSHYAIHNRFQPFDLPTSVLSGANLTFPPDYQWIYAQPPEVSYDPEAVTVSVDLQLVSPYEV